MFASPTINHEEVKPMAETNALQWGLPPDCGPPITFGEFLKKAASDPSMFDNVWQRARRNRDKGGAFDTEDDPYLQMLAAQDIKSWRVFAGIEGNEYTVEEIFKTEPVDLMVGLIGPTGSGKSMILDRYVSLVLGEVFWLIYKCRNNCGPESLLKLVSEDQIKKQPAEYGNAEFLLRLRARAVDLCNDCKANIFGTRDEPNEHPCLDEVQIQPMNLQARKDYGLAYWTPSASENNPGVLLEDAMKNGSLLFVMRQPFAQKGYASGGHISQFHPLLEAAAGGHRLSDDTPYRAQIVFENNNGGFKALRQNVTDVGTYLRRMRPVPRPYLNSVSRELRIYQTYLDTLETKPDFDPFVLECIAVTAVFSRMKRKSTSGSLPGIPVPELKPMERLRVCDGDLTMLELIFTKHAKGWNTKPIYTTGTDINWNLTEMLDRLRNVAGGEDCFEGLSPQFMVDNIIAPLAEDGLSFPERRVTFLIANDFMIKQISEQQNVKDTDAETDQKEMYKAVLAELKLRSSVNDDPKTIEAWYHRRLRHAMELAFFPKRDELRDARFRIYFNVATALSVGDRHFVNLKGDKSLISDKIQETVVRPMETSTLGLGADEVRPYRASLKDRAALYLRAEARRMGISLKGLEADWSTLPELKRACAMLEAEEHFKKIGICLDEKERENKPLDPDDVALLKQAMANLKALGYSDESLEKMLTYFRANLMWRSWNGTGSGHDVY
jgi:predicted Ser/Thr protein kinase